MKVRFNYADRKLGVSPTTTLKDLVKTIFTEENIILDRIDYIFCSDEYLLEINRQSLNHDYYTDIITFPLHEGGEPIQGEVYISVDRVRENAVIHKAAYKAELARVIAHGALHLCGYKDKSKNETVLMRKKESFYIEKIL